MIIRAARLAAAAAVGLCALWLLAGHQSWEGPTIFKITPDHGVGLFDVPVALLAGAVAVVMVFPELQRLRAAQNAGTGKIWNTPSSIRVALTVALLAATVLVLRHDPVAVPIRGIRLRSSSAVVDVLRIALPWLAAAAVLWSLVPHVVAWWRRERKAARDRTGAGVLGRIALGVAVASGTVAAAFVLAPWGPDVVGIGNGRYLHLWNVVLGATGVAVALLVTCPYLTARRRRLA